MAAGHSALGCQLSEGESYTTAQLPGAGIWLLGGEETWAQSQPWKEVHAQLGCPGLATFAEKAHVSRHTRTHAHTRALKHTACVCSFWYGAARMLHTPSYSHRCITAWGAEESGAVSGAVGMRASHIDTPHNLSPHRTPQESLSPTFLGSRGFQSAQVLSPFHFLPSLAGLCPSLCLPQ